MHRRLGTWIGCLALLAAGAACAGPVTYGRNVLRDVSDVVDVRYGTGFGLGASAQFTDLLATGLGCSVEWYQREWFGRKSVEVRDGLFAAGLLFGFDGDYLRRLEPGQWDIEGDSTTGDWFALLVNWNRGRSDELNATEAWLTEPAGDPPARSGLRFGGAVFLPGVHGGLYLNLGELVDFATALVGYDFIKDDGYSKYSIPSVRDDAAAAAPASTPST